MTTEHKFFTEAEAVALAGKSRIKESPFGAPRWGSEIHMLPAELHALCEAAANVGAEKAREQQEPVAVVRVTHGGYGMELSGHVAYKLPEGLHKVYTTPQPAAQDKLRVAAQLALECLEDVFGKNKVDVGAINEPRAALANKEQV